MEKIIACVVTYNRLDLLIQVIDGLRNQTRKIDEIVVINNSSTDGTTKWLAVQTDLTVITQDNLGSSGGQYTAAKYAYSKGADYIWLMDDDVVAKPNCLEILLKYVDRFDIVCPLRYNIDDVYFNDVKKITFEKPFKSIWREIISLEDLENEFIPVEAFTFEGPLIHRNVIEKIGLPEKGFFIYGDDTEFSIRALKSKMKAAVIKDAIFIRLIPPVPDKARFTWKTYYMVRNLTAIDKLHGKGLVPYIRPLGYLWSFLRTAENLQQFKTLLKALIDGYRYKSQN